MVQNKGLVYKSHPSGWPVPGEHFAVETRSFDLDAPPPKDGLIVKNFYISFDPYLRGRMRDPSVQYYSTAFQLGRPLNNFGIAKVLKSDNAEFKEGDVVLGYFSIEEYSSITGEIANAAKGLFTGVRKLENPYNLDPKYFVGALGMPGLTAFSSLYEIGKPKKGETIFVSAASGAVGQIVGQLAKHEGMKVIGSVGSDDKLDFIIKELGFDGGFNYKKEKADEALTRLAPNGISIYYENVGGEQLDAALNAMVNDGRIVCSGMVSQYNLKPTERYGPKNIIMVFEKQLTMRGFLVGQLASAYGAEHQKNVQKWLHDGTFKAAQHTTYGIDNAAEGFIGMLKGDNFGKAVLQIADLTKE